MAFNDDVQLSEEYQKLVSDAVAAEVQKLMATQGQGTPQVTPQADGGIKVKLWGEEKVFKDSADVQDFLERYMQTATEYASKSVPQAQPQAQQTAPARPKVDVEKYVELLAKDPLEAEQYKNMQMYGVPDPIRLVASEIANLRQSQQQTYLNQVAEQFKAVTENFPSNDPQAGVVLSSVVQKLNLPMTVEALQAGWNHILATGQYRPQGQTGTPHTDGGNSRAGLPYLDGGVSPGYSPIMEQFADLPLEQMEAALKRIERGVAQ